MNQKNELGNIIVTIFVAAFIIIASIIGYDKYKDYQQQQSENKRDQYFERMGEWSKTHRGGTVDQFNQQDH